MGLRELLANPGFWCPLVAAPLALLRFTDLGLLASAGLGLACAVAVALALAFVGSLLHSALLAPWLAA